MQICADLWIYHLYLPFYTFFAFFAAEISPSSIYTIYTFADACAPYGFGFAESTLRFASLIFGAFYG